MTSIYTTKWGYTQIYLRMRAPVFNRWLVLCEEDARTRIHDDAGAVSREIRPRHDGAMFHTCADGRDVLVGRHLVSAWSVLAYQCDVIYLF